MNKLEYLKKYMQAQDPTLNIILYSFDAQDDTTKILLTPFGGAPYQNIREDDLIQIKNRSANKKEAYNKAQDLYRLLAYKYTAIVYDTGVEVYRFSQILPIARPGYVGVDQNGYHVFSFNIKAVTAVTA